MKKFLAILAIVGIIFTGCKVVKPDYKCAAGRFANANPDQSVLMLGECQIKQNVQFCVTDETYFNSGANVDKDMKTVNDVWVQKIDADIDGDLNGQVDYIALVTYGRYDRPETERRLIIDSIWPASPEILRSVDEQVEENGMIWHHKDPAILETKSNSKDRFKGHSNT